MTTLGMGSITSVVITANGYIALDGNMREILVWNAAGTCIGEIEDSDLFGTSYPWMNGMCRGDDGNIYVCLVDERPDETWDEVLVYRLDTDF